MGTLAEYEKLLVLIEKIKVQGENYFNITQNEYKKALKQVQDKYTELKPKVMELYEKYVKLAKENIELVKTTVDAYISMATKEYNKIEEKVLALYEANKFMTSSRKLSLTLHLRSTKLLKRKHWKKSKN